LAAALGLSLRQVQARQQSQRRTRRLEAILEIAGQWNQQLEMESLLNQMAQASTRLLGAERASIFLWDRPQRQLVGRPALGVETGELRISDRRVKSDAWMNTRRTIQSIGASISSWVFIPARCSVCRCAAVPAESLGPSK
jgi:hypothetical protein